MGSPIKVEFFQRTTPCNPQCRHPMCVALRKQERKHCLGCEDPSQYASRGDCPGVEGDENGAKATNT